MNLKTDSQPSGAEYCLCLSCLCLSRRQLLLLEVLLFTTQPGAAADDKPNEENAQVSFESFDDSVVISVGDRTVARYVFADDKVQRPYFCDVKTSAGLQVTRNHPPVEGVDPDDHATMHPGVWLAFGDINGVDFWRNKGSVRHERWLEEPSGGRQRGGFKELKKYVDKRGKTVCIEEFCCAVTVDGDAWLLSFDSVFKSEQTIRFGDQEEMGLGIRVATPISEKSSGRLLDSRQKKTAKTIWGESAQWCDYSGTVDGQQVGITLIVNDNNFRPSWMHARDYGLIVANPFGRKAMKQGSESEVKVEPGQTLRLRFAVWVHGEQDDLATACQQVFERYQEESK